MRKLRFLELVLVGLVAIGVSAQVEQRQFQKETFQAKLDPALSAYHPSTKLSGSLKMVGPDVMVNLMKLWVGKFEEVNPDVKVAIESVAPGASIAGLTDGSAQLAPAARELFPAETAPFEQKYGYQPYAIRAGVGSYRTPGKTSALAFFVNKENPIENLSMAQLDAIYSSTRRRGYKNDITTWGQLGVKGEWADKPIVAYEVKRPNGQSAFLGERVLANGEYKDGIRALPPSGAGNVFKEIVERITADRYAIGYATFADATPGVKPLGLSETEGGPYFKGTFDEVASMKYPLSRFIYIFVNRPPGKPLDRLLREFLNFVLSREGQDALVKEGFFLPLSAEFVRNERTKLE